jgi:hypothetical protein
MEELEQIARAIGEGEHRAAAGIISKTRDDFGMQAIKRFAHVAGLQREEHTQAAGESQHGWRKACRSSSASGRAAREVTSTTVPHGSVRRSPVEADA